MSACDLFYGIWTVFLIYCIGFYYTVVEFFKDRFSKADRSYIKYLYAEIESSQFWRKSMTRIQPIALVTGASGTIGFEIVRLLLNLGYRVEALAHEEGDLLTLKDDRLSVHLIDMSDLVKVKSLTEEIVANMAEGIDVVVCSAGIMLHPYEVNRSGYEKHMAVNVLSHALLVDVLRLQTQYARHQTRIVFISSSTAHAAYIDADTLHSDSFFTHYINGYHAYAMSKLVLALYAEQLNRYFEEETPECYRGDTERCPVKVCSVHPGCVSSDLYKNVFYPCRILINHILAPFMRNGATAAAEVIATIMSDRLKGGTYYEHMKAIPLRPDISDAVRRQLFFRIQQTIREPET